MSNTNPTATAYNFLSFAKEAIVPPFPPRRSCCKFTIVWQQPCNQYLQNGRNETKRTICEGNYRFLMASNILLSSFLKKNKISE